MNSLAVLKVFVVLALWGIRCWCHYMWALCEKVEAGISSLLASIQSLSKSLKLFDQSPKRNVKSIGVIQLSWSSLTAVTSVSSLPLPLVFMSSWANHAAAPLVLPSERRDYFCLHLLNSKPAQAILNLDWTFLHLLVLISSQYIHLL